MPGGAAGGGGRFSNGSPAAASACLGDEDGVTDLDPCGVNSWLLLRRILTRFSGSLNSGLVSNRPPSSMNGNRGSCSHLSGTRITLELRAFGSLFLLSGSAGESPKRVTSAFPE